MSLANTKELVSVRNGMAVCGEDPAPLESSWVCRPHALSEPPHVPKKASKGQDTHMGDHHLSVTEICWEEYAATEQKTKSHPIKPEQRTVWIEVFLIYHSICYCFHPFPEKLGDRGISAYVPCMSPAFPKYLARNGQKWVLFIGHLTALIPTLLGQQCSGHSPHTCLL